MHPSTKINRSSEALWPKWRFQAVALSLTIVCGGLTPAWIASPATALAQQHPGHVLTDDEPLPNDDRLTTGELANGLKYIIREHSNPPGKVGIWLHIASGSLNEKDHQQGMAHFLEHMAFNGSENFKPFEVVDLFQSLGMTFGQDQNAFTSFEQTAYQLYLPDAAPETLAKGFSFFADVASKLTLDAGEIEKERGVILEERRTSLGPEERVRDQWLKRLAPGSLIADRLPIGTEETIKSVSRADFVQYYTDFYVPGNMTVLVVGDLKTGEAVTEIQKAFATLEARPIGEPNNPNISPYTEQRAIVAHDPELTTAQASLMIVDDAEAPAITVGGMRRELTTQLALSSFNRRLQNKVSAGEVEFQAAGAFGQNLFNAMHISQASANGSPAEWPEMLQELTVEVKRAKLHGFGERELTESQTSLLAQLEQTAEREATFPARVILSALAGRVNSGDAVISPQDSLELARQIIPTITRDDINDRFSDLFDLDRATFLVTLPTGSGVPLESAVLELGAAASELLPEPDLEPEIAEALIEEDPTPGNVVELAQHAGSGVWSAWLDNGVRMHHRFMDQRKNEVTIQITLAGGELLEDARTRGLSQAAVRAWQRAATRDLTSSQIRGFMAGVKATVSGAAGEDALSMSISASPEDLETGMQLAHILLTEPMIEPVGFEQWRLQTVQALEAQQTSALGMLAPSLADALFPEGETRGRPLTIEQVKAIKLNDAQNWLDTQISASPIEVSIVGDISREKAFALTAKYLGSIQNRDRINERTHSGFRKIEQPGSDPIRLVREVKTQTPAAGVLAGFFASDADNLRDTRVLNMATRALTTRLIKALREEARLVYSIGANLAPGEAYPGYGLLLAGSQTDPNKTDQLASGIQEVFSAFAETGPTEEEVATVKKQIAKQLGEALEQPGFWAGQLGQLDYRGKKLDDFMTALEIYQSFTAEDIHETFARYHNERSNFAVIVKPEMVEDAEPADEG